MHYAKRDPTTDVSSSCFADHSLISLTHSHELKCKLSTNIKSYCLAKAKTKSLSIFLLLYTKNIYILVGSSLNKWFY